MRKTGTLLMLCLREGENESHCVRREGGSLCPREGELFPREGELFLREGEFCLEEGELSEIRTGKACMHALLLTRAHECAD
jgi:hypothetical protein